MDILWNIIRNWFVVYVFGGHYLFSDTWIEKKSNFIISADSNGSVGVVNILTTENYMIMDNISLGDWLSTTATILVLCAMCFFLFLVVRWLFRLTAGLIQGRG